MATQHINWEEAAEQYRVYFLDFDGTTHQTKSGEIFPRGEDDLEWIPGRKEILEALLLGEYTAILIYISNQGGAAYGIFKPEDKRRTITNFGLEVGFQAAYICFHDTSEKAREKARVRELTIGEVFAGHSRRKPGGGMLLQAMQDLGVVSRVCVMVGDRLEDQGAAEDAGVDFIWAADFFVNPPIAQADAGPQDQG